MKDIPPAASQHRSGGDISDRETDDDRRASRFPPAPVRSPVSGSAPSAHANPYFLGALLDHEGEDSRHSDNRQQESKHAEHRSDPGHRTRACQSRIASVGKGSEWNAHPGIDSRGDPGCHVQRARRTGAHQQMGRLFVGEWFKQQRTDAFEVSQSRIARHADDLAVLLADDD